MNVSAMIASVFKRLLRIKGIFEVLGRKGGGFELFRGGYAKCIFGSDGATPRSRQSMRVDVSRG
jgi:hypothetical protein